MVSFPMKTEVNGPLGHEGSSEGEPTTSATQGSADNDEVQNPEHAQCVPFLF